MAALWMVVSFIGTRTLGPQRTADGLRRLGAVLRRVSRRRSHQQILMSVHRSLRFLPLPVECLDQAMATWFLLNRAGHAATLRIGMSITPLSQHAWVESADQIFLGIPNLADMTVIGEIPAWPAAGAMPRLRG